MLLHSGKLSREKTLTNFTVLKPPAKVFSTKFGCAVPTYMIGFSIPQKFSPQNGHFLPIHESSLRLKFPAIQYYASGTMVLYHKYMSTVFAIDYAPVELHSDWLYVIGVANSASTWA